MKQVDFGRAAEDYGRHRVGFPDALFARLKQLGLGHEGQRVLDMGTGTGALGRALARRGCVVTAIDKSEALLDQARKLATQEGLEIELVKATAARTRMPDGAFDAVTAGQCWHWFKRQKAAREARRVLKPGGILAIVHFDWIPATESVVEATETLIHKYNAAWTRSNGTGLYPKWLRDVASAGFVQLETFSFDVATPYTHEAWRGRVRASAGVSASLAPDIVARFDESLRVMLAERFPEEPLSVPHRAWALVCRNPS